MKQKYQKFLGHVNELYDIQYAQDLLSWDQETYMPHKGGRARARTMGSLAGMYHERLTAPKFVALVKDLKQSGMNGDFAVNVREMAHRQERAIKIPRELVVEISDTESLGYEAWVEARQKSDFRIFAPLLEKILDLKKRVAGLIGYEGMMYNAFLDIYEPKGRAEEITPLFAQLRDRLVPLLERVKSRGETPGKDILAQEFPIPQQEALQMRIIEDMGFDLQAGRLDVTVHPFCCALSPEDVRLTTRFNDRFPEPLFSTMHEAGHGLYEQGLPADAIGTPAGESISHSIHESQSRLWENMVGHSRPFLAHYLVAMKELFPSQLKNLDLDTLYAAVNQVRPSFIRTDADEVTYNLHIILRFELEIDMLEGRVKVSELPESWNQRMEKYLGIRPDSDAHGVLQDVHWSHGSIGYFPTYALGNLYSAQFFAQAQQDVPDLMEHIGQGRLSVLTKWLKEKIHSHGKRKTADQLVREVTGEGLKADFFIDYLEHKFTDLAARKPAKRSKKK